MQTSYCVLDYIGKKFFFLLHVVILFINLHPSKNSGIDK